MTIFNTDNPSIGKMGPVVVIGNESIRKTFDQTCLDQAINCSSAPGVERVILNPDGHAGYGAPVGCTMITSDKIYPGPVGFDISCSMSMIQTNLSEQEISDKVIRRKLVDAIEDRIPSGIGYNKPKKYNQIPLYLAIELVTKGLPAYSYWSNKEYPCEAPRYGNERDLVNRIEILLAQFPKLEEKLTQFGSIGGGNHFISIDVPKVFDKTVAAAFKIRNGFVSILNHFGSRGFGHLLASNQFRILQTMFEKWSIPLPGNDREMVYAPLDSEEGQNYLLDMYLGANFAICNHAIVNHSLIGAFNDVFDDVRANVVYHISHNLAREEIIDNKKKWVHRKGATRAYPSGHFELKNTRFENTGHPILLPGNVLDGSLVMVAEDSKISGYSINHGSGRSCGRKQAQKTFLQSDIDSAMMQSDVITNQRNYPVDESKECYKNFQDVTDSVVEAGLAVPVAKLIPKIVIKGND